MPVFGAHMSVSGGLKNAVTASTALNCDTVQIFTRNPNAWQPKPLTEADIRTFRDAVVKAGLQFPTAHDSYLINLASPDEKLFQKSMDAFTDEMVRAESLGLTYLVTHPGSHVGSGEEAGLARVVKGLDEVCRRCPGFSVKVLLETTAGQGTSLGHHFEHLHAILDNVKNPECFGICLDTCHVFAAGYGLVNGDDYAATWDEFASVVGLDHLRLFHINDSVKERGSRVDRHAGIGLGKIGLEAFRMLVTDPRFIHLPMILETPKEGDDAAAMDPVNLGILRGFLDNDSLLRAS